MCRIKRAAVVVMAALVAGTVGAAYCAEPEEDAQDSVVAKLIKHIPAGYRFFEGERGDLNGDGIEDDIIIIKATDKKKIVRYDHTGILVDRNRRGILIFLSNGDNYRLALENRQCFSSESEDGGNYVSPDLVIRVQEKGNLIVHYAHGRKGWWRYTFRYRKSDFELIGYDESSSYEEETISVNFLTKKQLIKNCIRKDNEGGCADCCSNKFKETWNDIVVKEPILLRKVVDFDELNIDNYISKK
jgi:hypothetical protein